MKYQFKCPECQMTDEVEAPIEKGPTYTPLCLLCSLFAPEGAPTVYMRRVWSAVPAVFRGGGWASKR